MFELLAQGPAGDVATTIANMPPTASTMQYLLVTAIGALASVVGFLWLRLEKSQASMVTKLDENNAATTAKLQECEKDRLDLWARVAKLEADKN